MFGIVLKIELLYLERAFNLGKYIFKLKVRFGKKNLEQKS